MFHPAPRRHRRLPTGTMVSYAEVKSYLSKREIPQLFESLMAGLMYHRPENHIGYLQSCLEEVKANSDTKVQWSTFVNAKKRKSKEILPPLTPKKQDSFSSWSDNSRQSTPLPPISARTRTRASMEQQDYRNTYILYHNPPPILAKPKVPVVSILGGLGTRIDELCEKVVRRLRGVVHISTCSMLKTRMTIEGFYRVTSVPACAVVDSVLQAMSMVQSAEALLVAGFPRNRGDIEEYRSRKVRMDGVVLVDFEEDALRHFLEHEVASGLVRTSEVDAELERFKQDIISVAEYYDEKELLTVVMGDQDTEEIVEDLILAIDKIIETRKRIPDEETIEGKNNGECISPCNAIMPSPDRLERPSTVEIRDATEEDIKSIEAESNQEKLKEDLEKPNSVDEAPKEDSEKSAEKQEDESNKSELKNDEQVPEDNTVEMETKDGEEMDKEVAEETLEETQAEKAEEKEDLENEKSNVSETDVIDEAKENKSEKDEPTKSDVNNNSAETSEINVKDDSLVNNKDNSIENEKSKATENDSPEKDDASDDDKQDSKENKETALEAETKTIPLVFSFENLHVDSDEIRNLIANDLEMCFIDFYELMRKDEDNDDEFDNDEALKMLKTILQQDSVSYSNGFFVFKLPFSLLNDSFIEQLLLLGNLNFVCKVKENKSDSLTESKDFEENKLFNSSFSEKVRIIFITEDNTINELREALQEIIENKNKINDTPESDNKMINESNQDSNNEIDKEKEAEANESDNKEEQTPVLNDDEELEDNISEKKNIENEEDKHASGEKDGDEENDAEKKEEDLPEEKDIDQEIDGKEEILHDVTEDSTGKDVEDLVSDTLNEGSKLPESFVNGDNPAETEADDTHSQASTLASTADETQRERAVLERQSGVELEAENEEDAEADQSEKSKTSLIRQGTYSADEMKNENKAEEIDEVSAKDVSPNESKDNDSEMENKVEIASEKESENDESSNKMEKTKSNESELEEKNLENEINQSQGDLNRAEEEVNLDENSEEKDKKIEAEPNSTNDKNEEDLNQEAEDNNPVESTDNDPPLSENAAEDSLQNTDDNIDDKEESKNEDEEKNESDSEVKETLEEGGDVLDGKETNDSETQNISPDNENETVNNDVEDEHSDKDKSKECSEANSERNDISAENRENSEEKSNECSESNEPLKNETDEPSLNEKENSPAVSQSNENEDENNDKSKQESENNSEDKNHENVNNDASLKLDTGIQKAIDNDSDSNDENITIETKAEVHAIDSSSPPASEKSESKCMEEEEEEENAKSNTENVENENSVDENLSNKNKLNEMNNVGDKNDSETLEIRDSLESERLSGKKQERSGSGILDESREPDPTEIEEPQERSSSSSRGEL